MIISSWYRFKQGNGWKWLLLAASIVIIDAVIGTTLLAWEMRMLKEAW